MEGNPCVPVKAPPPSESSSWPFTSLLPLEYARVKREEHRLHRPFRSRPGSEARGVRNLRAKQGLLRWAVEIRGDAPTINITHLPTADVLSLEMGNLKEDAGLEFHFWEALKRGFKSSYYH
ncbi:hypothetical protein GOP47_0029768 [Adiantum capillus-veneris]|nr:hypothetical protein GOP47_0029768 [Adiantum capillus-veneris]